VSEATSSGRPSFRATEHAPNRRTSFSAEPYESVHRRTPERETKEHNYFGTLYWSGAIALVLYLISRVLEWDVAIADRQGNGYWALAIAGWVLLSLGLYMVGMARIYLNGYWGVHVYQYNPAHQRLVTNGIYETCRHPVYVGQFIMTLGTFLASNNYLIVVLPVITAIFSMYRGIREDHDLQERFDDEFVNYRKRVSAWLPQPKFRKGRSTRATASVRHQRRP